MSASNRGWFRKGQSGNYNGRPRTYPNRTDALAIADDVMRRALQGDTHAADILTQHYVGDKSMPHGFFRDNGYRHRTRDQEHSISVATDPPDPDIMQEVWERMDRIEQALVMLAQRADATVDAVHHNEEPDFYETCGDEAKKEPDFHEITGDRATRDAAYHAAFILRTKQVQNSLKKINARNRANAAKG